jgi:hypothetical protein
MHIATSENFGALGSKGRWHCDKAKHPIVFNVACQITNISILREPVWLSLNPYIYYGLESS